MSDVRISTRPEPRLAPDVLRRSTVRSFTAATLIALAMATTVNAQDFNIDFSQSPADVPPASFAAAGQAGMWNGINPPVGGAAVSLFDVNGQPTSVTVSIPQYGSSVSFPLPDASLPTNVNTLFEDGISAGDLPEQLKIAGLRAGYYDLLMYGYVPTHIGWETWFLAPGGQQITVTLPWSGQFQLGVTHVKVRAFFNPEAISVFWANPTGIGAGEFGWLSGIQIKRVWKELGGGTTGVNGPPKLSMSGALVPGSPLDLSLTSGAPNAFSVVFMSVNSAPAPFLGGVLHAFPVTAQVFASTDASGALSGGTTFSGAPSGTQFTFQVGVVDPSVPIFGASLSNAVTGSAD